MDLRAVMIGTLLYVLLPLWLVAGVADYLCHRRTLIERTSGTGESLLHVAEAIEVGIPLLLGLFLEINALIFCIMLAGVTLHTLTALWDGLYTQTRRTISALEQHVHSHLEYVPWVALLLTSFLYWSQFCALFGLGTEPPSFAPEAKKQPIAPGYLLLVLAPVVLLQGGLLVEEFVRTYRYARRKPQAVARDSMDRFVRDAHR